MPTTTYSDYSDVESATTLALALSSPDAFQPMRLYLLTPRVVFAASVNTAAITPSITYPLDSVPYNTVTSGTYTDIRVGMTVLFGRAAGASDLGRQRIRKPPTADTLYIGRSSKGARDGEVTLTDDCFITVLDDYRVWAKVPYITPAGAIYKDSDLAVGDDTTKPPPVANCGPGYAATLTGSTITVHFDAAASFATAPGATITNYAWDVGDGTITVGTPFSSAITATFPAGFRWVALTVTDSNAKSQTARCPIFARDPDNDTSISRFQITEHRITPQGQQLSVRILEDVSASPTGTLVLLWEGEPISSSDRSHMRFIGWHQRDPASISAQRTATLRDTTLDCLDVAGKLDTLPGFSWSLENKATPTKWTEFVNPNINLYLHYLLHWHSTALELADWTWATGGEDFVFKILSSAGQSLFDQVNQRAGAFVPDRLFTCNRRGQLAITVDPLLQNAADRTTTVQAALTPAAYSDIRFTAQHFPRLHWLRGSAILANASSVTALFAVAPGTAPGQGVEEQTHGEQLALNQEDLNRVTGHRYARTNAPEGLFAITLASGDDLEIEPADLTWVTLTIDSDVAAQRGLTFAAARGLVKTLDIRYNYERSSTTKTVELQWERETEGDVGSTVVVAATAPVDTGPVTPVTPEPEPVGPYGIPSGENNVALIGDDGYVYRTTNFQSNPPTWTQHDAGMSDVQYYSFVVDPFSPGYRTTGAVNGWVAGRDAIWRIEDLFGTPSATAVYSFAYDDTDISHGSGKIHFSRTINASFGRYQATETDNPWLACISYYEDATGHNGTYITYSTDAGVTWSSEVQISAAYDSGLYSGSLTRMRPIALHLSPKTPGLAYAAAYATTGNPPTANGYVSTDWGATWSALLTPDIEPNHGLAGAIHAPWLTNDDETLVFHGRLTLADPIEYRVKRIDGVSTDDISPTDSGITYGVNHRGFAVRTYDSDRAYVAMGAVGNSTTASEDDDFHTVFVSDDGGDTWTRIIPPLNDGYFYSYRGYEVAFSGDDPNTLFIWGATPGEVGCISYSSDFGATVTDKSGNIFVDFYDPLGVPTGVLGIAGGGA